MGNDRPLFDPPKWDYLERGGKPGMDFILAEFNRDRQRELEAELRRQLLYDQTIASSQGQDPRGSLRHRVRGMSRLMRVPWSKLALSERWLRPWRRLRGVGGMHE